MSIHYRQYTDTFSILNHLQNHCLWRKNGQKLVQYYLENSKLPTKSSFVEKKTVKIGTILSRKSSKYPSWLAICNVYIRNELPTRLPARFNAIQHRGDILPIQTCGDIYVSFVYQYCHKVIDMSYRSVNVPTIDNFDNR